MPNHKLLHLQLMFKGSSSLLTQRHHHPLFSRRLSYSASSWYPGNYKLQTLLRPVMAKTHFFFSVGMRSLVHDGVCTLKLSYQRPHESGRGHFLPSLRLWWKRWIPDPDVVTKGLVGVNVAVFMLWKISDPTFMRKHFMVSLDNLKRGYIHTLVTSAFSHLDPGQLISNLFALFCFGTSIGRIFGSEFLLMFYLAGAVSGSSFFLMQNILKSYQGKHLSKTHLLGANGAVNAIILLNVFLFPKSKIYIYMIIPVNAALVAVVLIGSDLWMIKKGEGHSSALAHLGGAIPAALAYYRIKKGWWKLKNIKHRW